MAAIEKMAVIEKMADIEKIRISRATTWLMTNKNVNQGDAELIVTKLDGIGGKITKEELVAMEEATPHMINSIIAHLHRTPVAGGGRRRRKSKKRKSKKRKSKKKSRRRRTRRR